MKKNRFWIIFSLIGVTFLNCSRNISCDTLLVKYVDLDIATPISVECAGFETYFESSIKQKVLKESACRILVEHLTRLESASQIFSTFPDTRIKIQIVQNDSLVEEVCVGYNLVHYKGKNYAVDEKLRNYIQEVVSK
jgi:hypothetical protein